MEDYIKRQIDMIGQMLLLLAKKLGLIDGDDAKCTLQSVQEEINLSGLALDIERVVSEEHPIAYLVESFQFSDDAIETFTKIVMHSDAQETAKRRLLDDAITYLDGKGHYSISLHSYLS